MIKRERNTVLFLLKALEIILMLGGFGFLAYAVIKSDDIISVALVMGTTMILISFKAEIYYDKLKYRNYFVDVLMEFVAVHGLAEGQGGEKGSGADS
ncbi:MAG TPA: hypothetical protein VFT74_07300 [Isosphaeraceae bacterium]|nr:hypothetical protein [Isosphaeraceae bacterium]